MKVTVTKKVTEEITKYQVRELQKRQGWSRPYFNVYGYSTHNTRSEAITAMNACIIRMNGKYKSFDGWKKPYSPIECWEIVEKKFQIEIEPEIKDMNDMDMSELIVLKELVEKRIKEL